jgi:hypothetical protein
VVVVKNKFCLHCGWADFCNATCVATTGRMRYGQRTIWVARAMLATVRSAESKAYWTKELARGQSLLQSYIPAELARAA